ncbi:MAG: ABC transporter ATP-binding protein [Clostridia bacterium]|nr:ABC transporter ATP-binding protein [Clostridia bacterium]
MIKKLAKSIREYKKETILTPLSVAVEVVLEVIVPYLMAELIDKGVYEGSMDNIVKIGIELIVFTVLSLIFGALSGLFAAKASSGFAKNLRKDLYYKVQTFSFANIDKFSTSSIVTRLTTDVTNVQNAFQMIIRIAIRAPLMLIFSLVMALKINIKMSLIFLILIPIVGAILFILSRIAMPIFEKVFKKYDNLNNVVEENTSGIRVVKSFVLEEEEKEKFAEASQEIFELFTKGDKIVALNSPIMQFAMYSGMLLISWIGARLIITSNMTELTTGELTSLITYAIQILFSVMMLTMISVMLTISMSSAKRIVEVLDEEPSIKNCNNPVKKVKDGSIEYKNVAFSYIGKKNKEVLKNINFTINSGETVGIIGGTGVGKSSLVNLIPRLYDVTEGELLVGGVNVKKYDIEQLREAVSCVLQKNVLFSGTIKENLRWGNEDATDEELVEACKLAQADGFISEFPDKYDTYIEQGGTNVSGGQKQRICIARALLKKPKILILDDSTSAVDTKTDKLIRDAFNKKIPDTTKIIIAQRISSVEECDKIIVMKQGKIDAIGNHNELMKSNEIYKEVYESQTQQSE